MPYNLSSSKALRPYELLHLDIWGHISVLSIHGHKYFLTTIDDYSRFTFIILLKTKGQAREQVQNLTKMLEMQNDAKIKIIRTDNGPEFSMD